MGFREFTDPDMEKFTDWLVDNVCQSERHPEQVTSEFLAHCREQKVEPPTDSRVERIVRSALHRAERALCFRVVGRLGAAGHGEPRLAIVKMVALMAAVDSSGHIGGIIKVFPPGNVFAQAHAQGVSPYRALVSLTLVAKVQGLCVESDHRGKGMGAGMLDEAWRLHH